ncbi:glycosyltransferase family 2 protein [Metallosphaera tengchongensis]|uniref:Glycosyltransferase family 2 protein n=1 Tax=Metallosphaera tengchongensis TaxID=1532350 RepID=A0A6N0NZ87_9CREN|nr:glycosyltransferase family A protein [Metallosphaera tengchongensis]QKR00849.1 glycosyltransferase family 2 protein [Metallosphaera tengchongensis]
MEIKKDDVVISVIITAHNRRKFLKEAITSALNQEFDRSKHEVIVVKNFEDQEIDSFIEEKNVKSLYTEEEKSGGVQKVGAEESKGSIVCLLDDDDKFHEEKLRNVCHSFTRYKDLTFYHNNRVVIYDEGKVLLTPEV